MSASIVCASSRRPCFMSNRVRLSVCTQFPRFRLLALRDGDSLAKRVFRVRHWCVVSQEQLAPEPIELSLTRSHAACNTFFNRSFNDRETLLASACFQVCGCCKVFMQVQVHQVTKPQ